jgi:hypothetical protein
MMSVTIPERVRSSADYAFPKTGTLVIHCSEGSYVQTIADENGIKYELIE